MSRWKQKKKSWSDRKSRKDNKKRKRKYVVRRSYYPSNSDRTVNRLYKEKHNPYEILIPPKNFSLVNNTEETMDFFMKFARKIEAREFGKHFYIDSKEVDRVTVDALIYLIAILENEEMNITMKYSFSGNYPRNQEAYKIYAESGFNDYVKSHMKNLPKSNEKMCIVNGTGNKSEISRGFCGFVMDKLGKTRKEIVPLQKVLIELMSNVFYHAYKKNSFMAKKWYMYAEHVDDYVRCVFVDTGQGIAKTVKKNFGERIKGAIGIRLDDSKLIQAAFNESFRSATNEKHRGNGLSSVKSNVENDIFDRFEVLSGHGRCIFPKEDLNEKMIIENYNNLLYGTLYTFIIR